MTTQEIKELKTTNYVRVAQPHTNFWLDYAKSIINDYKSKFGTNFNLIVYSKIDIDTDYYVIPFSEVQDLFKDEYLSKDKNSETGKRWVASIKNHIFKLTNNPISKDVKEYYANPYLTIKYDEQAESNEFEIENKRQEINVRLRQSKFRKGVLNNFNSTCCISNINEEDLLVASHIIPWADKKETRLDPTNGLCLSILYDKLFDKGYFTITDDLKIQTIQDTSNLSKPLVDILNSINGNPILTPNKAIKLDYLKYHQEKIFIDRPKE
jgi:hypothetical protein